MRFNELVPADRRPDGAPDVTRATIVTDTRSYDIQEDNLANAGFVRGLFDKKQQKRDRASRRGFLKGSIAAASATVAVAASKIPGSPAKVADAQGSVSGPYGYRIYTACPSFAVNHNCEPGCGSTPVCSGCCTADGWFINDNVNFRLLPGICTTPLGATDGWLWAYGAPCGSCSSIEYRCHDGLDLRSGVAVPSICRAVTRCGGVSGGVETPAAPTPVPYIPAVATPTPTIDQLYCPPGYTVVNTGSGYICQQNSVAPPTIQPPVAAPTPPPQQGQCPPGYYVYPTADGDICLQDGFPPPSSITNPPAAAPTQVPSTSGGFSVLGSVESVVDNGGSVTIRGWMRGPTTASINYAIDVDDVPTFYGLANGYRPDVYQVVSGAGQYNGFSATIANVAAGSRRFCVYGVAPDGSRTLVNCVTINVYSLAQPTAIPPTAPTPTSPPATSTPVVVAAPTPTAVSNPTTNVPIPTGTGTSITRPVGSVEVMKANSDGGAFVSGWVGDADTSQSVVVVVTVDGTQVASDYARLSRTDVGAALPQLGNSTGYSINVPFPSSGSHLVCVYYIDPIDGERYLSGCRTITGSASAGAPAPVAPTPAPTPVPTSTPVPAATSTPVPAATATPVPAATSTPVPAATSTPVPPAPSGLGNAVGSVERLEASGPGQVRVAGWMYFPSNPALSASYEVVGNGQTIGYAVADSPRADVDSALNIGLYHGFDQAFPAPSGTIQVEIYAVDGAARTGLLGLRTIQVQ